MTELDYRTAIAMFLNETYREDEIMNIAKIQKCDKCEIYELEEDMFQDLELSDKPWYCKKCWEKREFV